MRRIMFSIGFAVVVLILGLMTVWIRSQVLAVRFEIKQMAQTEERLEQELRSLTLAIATLKAPQRIANVATFRQGLRLSRSEDVVAVP